MLSSKIENVHRAKKGRQRVVPLEKRPQREIWN